MSQNYSGIHVTDLHFNLRLVHQSKSIKSDIKVDWSQKQNNWNQLLESPIYNGSVQKRKSFNKVYSINFP